MWYTQIGSYDSTIKRNEVLLHTIVLMNLENTVLNERSQTQKGTLYDS
jgi:hypothetical protein